MTGKYKKLLFQVLCGVLDANIPFADLRNLLLLLLLGFEERVRGSHHNFRKEGVEAKVNLQNKGRILVIEVKNKLSRLMVDEFMAEKLPSSDVLMCDR